jgi:hypothetical protein
MRVEQLVGNESLVGGAERRSHVLCKGTNQVTLTLHTQALRRMETSYAILAHLVGDKTGDLMAQADFIPYDSTIPDRYVFPDVVEKR